MGLTKFRFKVCLKCSLVLGSELIERLFFSFNLLSRFQTDIRFSEPVIGPLKVEELYIAVIKETGWDNSLLFFSLNPINCDVCIELRIGEPWMIEYIISSL